MARAGDVYAKVAGENLTVLLNGEHLGGSPFSVFVADDPSTLLRAWQRVTGSG